MTKYIFSKYDNKELIDAAVFYPIEHQLLTQSVSWGEINTLLEMIHTPVSNRVGRFLFSESNNSSTIN